MVSHTGKVSPKQIIQVKQKPFFSLATPCLKSSDPFKTQPFKACMLILVIPSTLLRVGLSMWVP